MGGAPTFLSACAFVQPQTALGAPRLRVSSLSPCQRPYSLLGGARQKVVGSLLSPDPQGGGLKNSPSGLFLSPKKLESN